MIITPFKSLIEKYKVLFFDSYGVLKNYAGAIQGSHAVIDKITELGKQFLVLTNDASRSTGSLRDNFHILGFNNIDKEKIVSSGMLTMDYLSSKVNKGSIVYLGTEASARYIRRYGFQAVSITDIFDDQQNLTVDNISGLVFLDDEGFDWKLALNNCVNLLKINNITTVVANSDMVYPKTRNSMNIAIGSLANMVERIVNKHFIYFGKPDLQIFNKAMLKLNNIERLDKKDILMVGDTLTTDILGANKFGIASALVLTGNTRATNYEISIQTTGIIPNYVCNSIAD